MFDYVNFIWDELYDCLGLANSKQDVCLEYPTDLQFQKVFKASQQAFKRKFDAEEHYCGICARNLLGNRFFFLSGCEHFYCLECMQEAVEHDVSQGSVTQLKCPGCAKPLNDLDVKQMGLAKETVALYEKQSLHNAIAQMEDLGWCPLPGCSSLANIERSENTGRCQHCEFLFCLDCKQGTHPFKRCALHRIDLH